MFKKFFDKSLFGLTAQKKKINLTEYWRDRAKRYGKRSVLNLAHNENQFDFVTIKQKELLFPLLQAELTGEEKILLDFGCGPGRFTGDLAKLIGGSAIGVDITTELLNLAPKSSDVTYQSIKTDSIPFPDSFFDVVWSCLVLGGIPEEGVQETISEIARVLRPGGIFFYVENTAKIENSEYWFFRDEAQYIFLASFCEPRVVGSYEDMGQTVTIFTGKKSQKIE